jgi:hypothetical protein
MAMLYRDMSGEIIRPERDWKELQRLWTRPALIYRSAISEHDLRETRENKDAD